MAPARGVPAEPRVLSSRGARTAGKFETDLTDDLSDLTPENLAALLDWRTFYTEHKVGTAPAPKLSPLNILF